MTRLKNDWNHYFCNRYIALRSFKKLGEHIGQRSSPMAIIRTYASLLIAGDRHQLCSSSLVIVISLLFREVKLKYREIFDEKENGHRKPGETAMKTGEAETVYETGNETPIILKVRHCDAFDRQHTRAG